MQSPPFPRYLAPPRSKYCPQHPVLKRGGSHIEHKCELKGGVGPFSIAVYIREFGSRWIIIQNLSHRLTYLAPSDFSHVSNKVVATTRLSFPGYPWNSGTFGDSPILTYLLNSWLTYLLTYFLTYLHTPWSTVLLEKLTGSQSVKKFPAFYGTRRFITAVTSARHLSQSWASWTQSPELFCLNFGTLCI